MVDQNFVEKIVHLAEKLYNAVKTFIRQALSKTPSVAEVIESFSLSLRQLGEASCFLIDASVIMTSRPMEALYAKLLLDSVLGRVNNVEKNIDRVIPIVKKISEKACVHLEEAKEVLKKVGEHLSAITTVKKPLLLMNESLVALQKLREANELICRALEEVLRQIGLRGIEEIEAIASEIRKKIEEKEFEKKMEKVIEELEKEMKTVGPK